MPKNILKVKNNPVGVIPQDMYYNFKKFKYTFIIFIEFFIVNLDMNVISWSNIFKYTLELLFNGKDVDDRYII